jgi:hypothetical protein
MDERYAGEIRRVLEGATRAYAELGKALPFTTVVVNPISPNRNRSELAVYLISDTAKVSTSKDGCSKAEARPHQELDNLSVRGGCVVTATENPQLRCSVQAVQIFGATGEQGFRSANPALLYVLAHELGHLHLNQVGEYAGRVESINLTLSHDAKLRQLRAACDPADVRAEAEADTVAIEVLKRLLPHPPYREPALSEQGSLYWSIDRINLAANNWQKVALGREFISQPKPHRTFIPTEFPTDAATVERNSREFVCEVLNGRSGIVQYPLRAIDHPPLEQRMRLVAEALKPIASRLPASSGKERFPEVAKLQEQLSPIFTHIYRETGVYLENMRRNVCSRVNSESPAAGCAR